MACRFMRGEFSNHYNLGIVVVVPVDSFVLMVSVVVYLVSKDCANHLGQFINYYLDDRCTEIPFVGRGRY